MAANTAPSKKEKKKKKEFKAIFYSQERVRVSIISSFNLTRIFFKVIQ